jgi:hypothetical protein
MNKSSIARAAFLFTGKNTAYWHLLVFAINLGLPFSRLFVFYGRKIQMY